jgi:hypothetical protein
MQHGFLALLANPSVTRVANEKRVLRIVFVRVDPKVTGWNSLQQKYK